MSVGYRGNVRGRGKYRDKGWVGVGVGVRLGVSVGYRGNVRSRGKYRGKGRDRDRGRGKVRS